MLILPLHRKIDWKHPPFVMLFLVVLNLCVFLFWQLDDEAQFTETVDYYYTSGLYDLEKMGYAAYLETQGDAAMRSDVEADGLGVFEQLIGIQTDPVFLERLQSDEVIESGDENYSAWRDKRTNLDRLYEEITYVGYGLRTGKLSWVSPFSHMFLHAGFAHLLGNLLFLIALGILVEGVMGSAAFLGLYLLSGLGAAGFDLLFNPGSLVPGIGASGAISGLMGMCAVVYGTRKIRFFYSMGVYFDYVALPAIVLLPLWIGNELLQLLLYSESQINYLAHLGGLVSGAAMAALLKYTVAPFDLNFLDVEKEALDVETRLTSARDFFQAMEYKKALLILRRLYREGRREREVVYLYYQCSRISPESEDFHRAARAIFSIVERDAATAGLVRETYHEYVKLAKPRPKLNEKILCRLAARFVEQKWCEEADRIMPFMYRKRVACLYDSDLAYRYAALLEAQGRSMESARYLKMIK